MEDTAYTLLSLGMRYWFLLLMILTLARAFFLMWQDRRGYHRALRHLPDAGLVGEVVDMDTGKSQPLPREGLIGSGRSCDIRLGGLRRRELEFVFRNGLGLKLIPLHRRHYALLDGRPLVKSRFLRIGKPPDAWQGGDSMADSEPLTEKNAYALHGTILEINGKTLRFRLFAGLNLPRRMEMTMPSWGAAEAGAYETPVSLNGFDSTAAPPEADLDITWQYAPLPTELLGPPETSPDEPQPGKSRRFGRGGQRHE